MSKFDEATPHRTQVIPIMPRSQEPNDNDRRIDHLYDEVAEVRADLKADIGVICINPLKGGLVKNRV
jgi:hypothetical protein